MSFVELKPAPNNKDIFLVEYLQQYKYKFEPPSTNGILLNPPTAKDTDTQKTNVHQSSSRNCNIHKKKLHTTSSIERLLL
jgi:hypothetical protein